MNEIELAELVDEITAHSNSDRILLWVQWGISEQEAEMATRELAHRCVNAAVVTPEQWAADTGWDA